MVAGTGAQRRQGGRVAPHSDARFVLAQAGILTGRGCTLLGGELSTFRELYPGIRVLDNLCTVNGPVPTCAGGMAALDMCPQIVAEVAVLPDCTGPDNPAKYTPYTAGAHKYRRYLASYSHPRAA